MMKKIIYLIGLAYVCFNLQACTSQTTKPKIDSGIVTTSKQEKVETTETIKEKDGQSLKEEIQAGQVKETVSEAVLVDNQLVPNLPVSPLLSDGIVNNSLTANQNSERIESNPPLPNDIANSLLINQPTGLKRQLVVTPQIQQVWNYCAPTTVSMMLSSRGVWVDQYQLAQEMGTYEPFGTHNRDAIRVLNRHLFGYDYPAAGQAGYRLETVTSAEATSEDMRLFKERLIQNINDGYPMYYTFDVSKINPNSYGEHNVIGTGYELTADGLDVAYVYYLDPSPNAQDPIYGGLKKISPQALLTAMLTCQEPNYGW